jgi:hypothetical protein
MSGERLVIIITSLADDRIGSWSDLWPDAFGEAIMFAPSLFADAPRTPAKMGGVSAVLGCVQADVLIRPVTGLRSPSGTPTGVMR